MTEVQQWHMPDPPDPPPEKEHPWDLCKCGYFRKDHTTSGECKEFRLHPRDREYYEYIVETSLT